MGCKDDPEDLQDVLYDKSLLRDLRPTEVEIQPHSALEESSLDYYDKVSRSSCHFGKVYSGLYPVGPRLPNFSTNTRRSRYSSSYNEDEYSSSSAASNLVSNSDMIGSGNMLESSGNTGSSNNGVSSTSSGQNSCTGIGVGINGNASSFGNNKGSINGGVTGNGNTCCSGNVGASDDKMYIDFPIRNFWKIAKTPIDMESPQIGYCRGFYYRLLVHPRGGSCNDSENSYLSVFLEALYHESYPDDWVFPNVRFQLSVVNFLDPKANITSWAHWTFSHDAMSRGWHKMVSHARLTKSAGFVDEEGTVLIRGRAEPPFPRIWSRSPKCRPWNIWGTLPYRNASTMTTVSQFKHCIEGNMSKNGCKNYKDREYDVGDEDDVIDEYDNNEYDEDGEYRNDSSESPFSPSCSSGSLGSMNTNLCPFHEMAEKNNRGLTKYPIHSSDSTGMSISEVYGVPPPIPTILPNNQYNNNSSLVFNGSSLPMGNGIANVMGSPGPLSIMDRLLWSSSNLFVPTVKSHLNVDFVPAFVHLLYHIKEFRRAVFTWNSNKIINRSNNSSGKNHSSCQSQEKNSDRLKRSDTTNSDSSQTSIIEALQKTFAYMTLWPIAYSVKRSIRHNWQERIATDPTIIDGWCNSSRCCKCGGENFFKDRSVISHSSSQKQNNSYADTGNVSSEEYGELECSRCKLPPPPNCSKVMKALYMNDLQRIDVSDPLMRFHCFVFGAIYLESAHTILQIAAHHRKSLPGGGSGNNNNSSNSSRDNQNSPMGPNGKAVYLDNNTNQFVEAPEKKTNENDNNSGFSISSIFELEEDLRVPTEFDNTCRVLFSSVAEDGGDCFSDYSTCCLRAKHVHSIPKAIEQYAGRFKRFPETLFIYFTPPKNAKKGELFDVPFRLEASFLLEGSTPLTASCNGGVGQTDGSNFNQVGFDGNVNQKNVGTGGVSGTMMNQKTNKNDNGSAVNVGPEKTNLSNNKRTNFLLSVFNKKTELEGTGLEEYENNCNDEDSLSKNNLDKTSESSVVETKALGGVNNDGCSDSEGVVYESNGDKSDSNINVLSQDGKLNVKIKNEYSDENNGENSNDDECSLDYGSEEGEVEGFDNRDVSIQLDSLLDDASGRKYNGKSPNSDSNFFGTSSQYLEKWYSLYGVIIREGDGSGGTGGGIGGAPGRSLHQLLIRPEEDGPWFRVCDGLIERLIPKIEFTEWKCHGGFFCAAAVYVAEDYIDSIAAGDVLADCDLKSINPELYQDTLDILEVTEEELQYIPSWVSTQATSNSPGNTVSSITSNITGGHGNNVDGSNHTEGGCNHFDVPTSELDQISMCVDIANVTVCDSTTCVFGHPLMDSGLSIDPNALWTLVDFRWGWPQVNNHFQLQEPLIQAFSVDPCMIISGKTVFTQSAQAFFDSLMSGRPLKHSVAKFWGLILETMFGPDLDPKDLLSVLNVVPHLRVLTNSVFSDIKRLLNEFDIPEEEEDYILSESELFLLLTEPGSSGAANKIQTCQGQVVDAIDGNNAENKDSVDGVSALDVLSATQAGQDEKSNKKCQLTLQTQFNNPVPNTVLTGCVTSLPSSIYENSLLLVNRLHSILWPYLLQFAYDLLPVTITMRLKRLLFKNSDDLLFDPRLTPEDLCARFLTESKFLLESSCCPLNLIRFCDNKQLFSAAINQVLAALESANLGCVPGPGGAGGTGSSSCSITCPTNRMIDRFTSEVGSSHFVIPIVVYIMQVALTSFTYRASLKLEQHHYMEQIKIQNTISNGNGQVLPVENNFNLSKRLILPFSLTHLGNANGQCAKTQSGVTSGTRDHTPSKQSNKKKSSSSSKSSSGLGGSGGNGNSGSVYVNPLSEAIQHLQVNQVAFSYVDPYVFIPLHSFHVVSSPLLVGIIFEHDLIGRDSFASESNLCASRVLYVNRLATVRHLYNAIRKILYLQFLDTKIGGSLNESALDHSQIDTPQSRNSIFGVASTTSVDGVACYNNYPGQNFIGGATQQCLIQGLQQTNSSSGKHSKSKNSMNFSSIQDIDNNPDSSWVPSNPLDVFCLYSLRPDTDPTRRGRLVYTYMHPNDFLEHHYYCPLKSNYITFCDVAVLLCVPPELKLQPPPQSTSNQVNSVIASSVSPGAAASILVPGGGGNVSNFINGASQPLSSQITGESNELYLPHLYSCPSRIAHSTTCNSSRAINQTVPRLFSNMFRAKLIDPLWSNTKFPMNDDSIAPLLIFKWFDPNTLNITLLSASICEARKSLRDCIATWVFPRARKMGLISKSASKETPSAEDYMVMEECHVRVCQNVRRWTSSIKKINRTTGDVFIIQKRGTNGQNSQPSITECPFISPFISAALSTNSYSTIFEDLPSTLTRDELLAIISSMNSKRLSNFGIFNATPPIIKGFCGPDSPISGGIGVSGMGGFGHLGAIGSLAGFSPDPNGIAGIVASSGKGANLGGGSGKNGGITANVVASGVGNNALNGGMGFGIGTGGVFDIKKGHPAFEKILQNPSSVAAMAAASTLCGSDDPSKISVSSLITENSERGGLSGAKSNLEDVDGMFVAPIDYLDINSKHNLASYKVSPDDLPRTLKSTAAGYIGGNLLGKSFYSSAAPVNSSSIHRKNGAVGIGIGSAGIGIGSIGGVKGSGGVTATSAVGGSLGLADDGKKNPQNSSPSQNVDITSSVSSVSKKKKKSSKKLPGIPSLQKSSIVKALNAQRRLESQSIKSSEQEATITNLNEDSIVKDEERFKTESSSLALKESEINVSVSIKQKTDKELDVGDSVNIKSSQMVCTNNEGVEVTSDAAITFNINTNTTSTSVNINQENNSETGKKTSDSLSLNTENRKEQEQEQEQEQVDSSVDRKTMDSRKERFLSVPDELYNITVNSVSNDSFSVSNLISQILELTIQKYAEYYVSSLFGKFDAEKKSLSERNYEDSYLAFSNWMRGFGDLLNNMTLIGNNKKVDIQTLQREVIQYIKRYLSNETNLHYLTGIENQIKSELTKAMRSNELNEHENKGDKEIRMYKIVLPLQIRIVISFTKYLISKIGFLPSSIIELYLGLLPKTDYVKANSLIKSTGYKSVKSIIILCYFFYIFDIKDAMNTISTMQGVKGVENLLIRITSFCIGLKQYTTKNFVDDNISMFEYQCPDWISSLRITDKLSIYEEIIKLTIVNSCEYFSSKSNSIVSQSKKTLDLIQYIESIILFNDIDDFTYEKSQLDEMRKVGKEVPEILLNERNWCVIFKPPFWYCSYSCDNKGISFEDALNSGRMESIYHYLREKCLLLNDSNSIYNNENSGIIDGNSYSELFGVKFGVDIGAPVLFFKNRNLMDVYIKNVENLSKMQFQFTFLCHGQMQNTSDTNISLSNIVCNSANRIFSKCLSSDGTESIAKYSVCQHLKFKNYKGGSPSAFSLCTCTTKLGNVNKIRTYMHQIGHTIVGDTKYLGQKQLNLDRKYFPNMFFYCTHFEFPNPDLEIQNELLDNDEMIQVFSPVPREVMELLENDFESTERFRDMHSCSFYRNFIDSSEILNTTSDNIGVVKQDERQDAADDDETKDEDFEDRGTPPIDAPENLLKTVSDGVEDCERGALKGNISCENNDHKVRRDERKEGEKRGREKRDDKRISDEKRSGISYLFGNSNSDFTSSQSIVSQTNTIIEVDRNDSQNVDNGFDLNEVNYDRKNIPVSGSSKNNIKSCKDINRKKDGASLPLDLLNLQSSFSFSIPSSFCENGDELDRDTSNISNTLISSLPGLGFGLTPFLGMPNSQYAVTGNNTCSVQNTAGVGNGTGNAIGGGLNINNSIIDSFNGINCCSSVNSGMSSSNVNVNSFYCSSPYILTAPTTSDNNNIGNSASGIVNLPDQFSGSTFDSSMTASTNNTNIAIKNVFGSNSGGGESIGTNNIGFTGTVGGVLGVGGVQQQQLMQHQSVSQYPQHVNMLQNNSNVRSMMSQQHVNNTSSNGGNHLLAVNTHPSLVSCLSEVNNVGSFGKNPFGHIQQGMMHNNNVNTGVNDDLMLMGSEGVKVNASVSSTNTNSGGSAPSVLNANSVPFRIGLQGQRQIQQPSHHLMGISNYLSDGVNSATHSNNNTSGSNSTGSILNSLASQSINSEIASGGNSGVIGSMHNNLSPGTKQIWNQQGPQIQNNDAISGRWGCVDNFWNSLGAGNEVNGHIINNWVGGMQGQLQGQMHSQQHQPSIFTTMPSEKQHSATPMSSLPSTVTMLGGDFNKVNMQQKHNLITQGILTNTSSGVVPPAIHHDFTNNHTSLNSFHQGFDYYQQSRKNSEGNSESINTRKPTFNSFI
ncbi:large having a MATH plus possible UBC hydrolase plus type I pseurousyn plus hexapeptide [Cryptosporidium xiaoi]|uniref:Large having a MATH plus possible UBC hydrolase plus type I pseurousyn plus hexapeptide n=1 Tax=Cryptosporidium xiaoi TaxID=659607 RepID=A0AAV9XYW3_9CRYT